MSVKKQCHKVKFLREEDVLAHIKRMRKKSESTARPARPYLCKICNVWHTTSQIDIKEVEELKRQLKEKEEQILQLQKAENRKLKSVIKIDDRIIELNKALTKHKLLIGKLRKDNSNLISEVIQLRRKNSNG